MDRNYLVSVLTKQGFADSTLGGSTGIGDGPAERGRAESRPAGYQVRRAGKNFWMPPLPTS